MWRSGYSEPEGHEVEAESYIKAKRMVFKKLALPPETFDKFMCSNPIQQYYTDSKEWGWCSK